MDSSPRTDGQKPPPSPLLQLGLRMAEMGVRHALFTDVSRDGALSGSNVQATIELAQQTTLQVIASGGVATLDELTLT
jgi:phosphoribosylformimino-5-aminoimidazole carboxamide ribotide isomerase